MELILKQDVENLGFADDVVNVKNGYGRNFLIPQGKAVMATTSAKKQLEETLKQRAFKEKSIVDAAQASAMQLDALELKINAKAGQGNKLFGSVNNADLADALAKEGIEIEKKYITIAGGTIKTVGNFSADVRFHRTVKSTFSFDVVGTK